MVNTTDFYLLKLQYEGEDALTGDIKKMKKEYLAECINYTDAEKLVGELIVDEEMNKFSTAQYEIQKLKINDLKYSEHLSIEEDSLGGLTELFFEDGARFYKVKVEEPDDSGDRPKTIKYEMFIPAASTGEAENLAKRFFVNGTVINTTMMNFENAFVLKQTCGHIKSSWANI